jgi:hypothetical protein
MQVGLILLLDPARPVSLAEVRTVLADRASACPGCGSA